MSNFSNARTGRIYVGTQSAIGSPATLTGASACRHTKVSLKAMNPRTPRNDKTGTLSKTAGIGGLRMCSVSCDMDLAANGAPGVKPDCDPFLQSIFGAAPTIVASTSVTYNLADAFIPITIGHFRLPSTVQQQIAWGVAISSVDWGFNDGVIAKMKMSGSGVWVPDSFTLSTLDSVGAAGLISSAFTEPTSPVTNGGVATAFRGSLTVDSTVVATVKSGSLGFKKPISPQYAYGNAYPQGWGMGTRNIGLKFDLWDDDSSMMLDLLQHDIQDTVIGATLVIGNVAGNIWTFTMTGLQLSPPTLDDGSNDRWVAQFPEVAATTASIGATTEVILAIT